MSELHIVNFAAYHRERSQQPRNFEQFQDMVCASRKYKGQPKGIWELLEINPKTREVLKRIWNMNVITDQGANYMLQRTLNSSAATLPALFNNLLITNNDASTTLNANIAANQSGLTTINVSALPAALPNGTQLVIGFGGSNPLTVTVNNSGGYAQGASGNITVNSFNTGVGQSFSIGALVVPVPLVTDNPTNTQLTSNATTPLSQYSGNLATNAFTYTPTSGAGNRTALVQYEFDNSTNGGTTPNGGYTSVWIVNVSSGATTNNYLAHEINSVLQVGNNSSILAKATVKV